MTETIGTVYGDDQTDATIPDEYAKSIKTLISELETGGFQVDREELKSRYVTYLNNTTVAAQGDGRWKLAFRALRAYYNGLAYAQGVSYSATFQPFSVAGKPFKTDKGTYANRVFGLISSKDRDFEMRGPASIRVDGYVTESTAQAAAEAIKTGTCYRIRANPSNKSPTGQLKQGEAGFLFSEASKPWEAAPVPSGETAYWTIDSLLGYFPSTAVGEILSTPQPNRMYRVDAAVATGRTGVNKTNGQTNGSLTLSDESVVGTIGAASKGGMFLFLPRDLVHLANLPSGSLVSVLIDGYQSAVVDKTGAQTGDTVWRWNVHAIKTVADMSGGTTIPNPLAPAIQIGVTSTPSLGVGAASPPPKKRKVSDL